MRDSRLQERLVRWEEGDLGPAELEELSDLLRKDPEARRELLFHSMMTSGIGRSLGSGILRRPETPFGRWGRLARLALGLAAAALVAVLVSRMGAGERENNPPLAVRPPGRPESPLSRRVVEEPPPGSTRLTGVPLPLPKAEGPDGPWSVRPGEGSVNRDTRIGLLFLPDATHPLMDVAVVGEGNPK